VGSRKAAGALKSMGSGSDRAPTPHRSRAADRIQPQCEPLFLIAKLIKNSKRGEAAARAAEDAKRNQIPLLT
jgi:hypothetical protein